MSELLLLFLLVVVVVLVVAVFIYFYIHLFIFAEFQPEFLCRKNCSSHHAPEQNTLFWHPVHSHTKPDDVMQL